MKRSFVVCSLALISACILIFIGYHSIVVEGLTRDAVQVTVRLQYWSLDSNSEWNQKRAVRLALAETDPGVAAIYTNPVQFRKQVANRSSIGITSMQVSFEPTVLAKLQRNYGNK